MPLNLLHRSIVGPAMLLTAMLTGCRDDPAPQPDTRATQVAPKKEDKPVAEKSTPSAAPTIRATAAIAEKPMVAASSAPSAAAAPSASAAASAAPPPAPPADPALDCDKLLTPDDVFAACNMKVTAPADQPTEDIGAEPRCSRKFESKEAGLLTLIVMRHAGAAEAKERYQQDFKVEWSKPEPIAGAGEISRFFLKKGVSGDPILTAEAVKERFNVTLFNPKVTVGGQTVGPVCDQKGLEKLLVTSLERVP